MTFFEKELKNFFSKDILIGDKVYFDKTLVGRLNETTNIKVCLETRGYADHYYGLVITVINKAHGTIDEAYIKFSDVWGTFVMAPNNMNYHIRFFRSDDINWYGKAPTRKQIDEYMQTVSNYIQLYK